MVRLKFKKMVTALSFSFPFSAFLGERALNLDSKNFLLPIFQLDYIKLLEEPSKFLMGRIKTYLPNNYW